MLKSTIACNKVQNMQELQKIPKSSLLGRMRGDSPAAQNVHCISPLSRECTIAHIYMLLCQPRCQISDSQISWIDKCTKKNLIPLHFVKFACTRTWEVLLRLWCVRRVADVPQKLERLMDSDCTVYSSTYRHKQKLCACGLHCTPPNVHLPSCICTVCPWSGFPCHLCPIWLAS